MASSQPTLSFAALAVLLPTPSKLGMKTVTAVVLVVVLVVEVAEATAVKTVGAIGATAPLAALARAAISAALPVLQITTIRVEVEPVVGRTVTLAMLETIIKAVETSVADAVDLVIAREARPRLKKSSCSRAFVKKSSLVALIMV